MFGNREDKRTIDLPDPADPADLLPDQGFVGAHISHNDLKKEVVLAGNVITLLDFLHLLDRPAESLDRHVLVKGKADCGKGGDAQSQLFGIQQGRVALDQSGAFQGANPLQDARRREPDAFGEVGVCNSPILLEEPEKLDVDFIDHFHSVADELSTWGAVASLRVRCSLCFA